MDYTNYFYDELNLEIQKIKNSLPQEMIFEIECELDELDDEVINYVSNQTGWLVNSIKYTIIP